MSNRIRWITLLLAPFIAVVAGASEPTMTPENTDGDSAFRGNRRPGILGPATEYPTGENARIFRRLGTFSATEMLDLVSEPVSESSAKN